MKKKLFIITIPMLQPDELKFVTYYDEFNNRLCDTRFPGIVMLSTNLSENDSDDNIKIITIRNEKEDSQQNYIAFLEELNNLAAQKGINLPIPTEIIIPYAETEAKHLALFSNIINHYEETDEVYMDITYGSKVTSIELFATLSYAAEAKSCSIEELSYGLYDHSNDSPRGIYYSLRYLHDIVGILTSSGILPPQRTESLIKNLLDE